MNIYTKNIASLLNITIEEAVRVQDQMEINGVDFSEVSTRTFNKEARAAAQEITSAILTTEQMVEILKNNKISECTPKQKEQVMAFAFGDEFVESDKKGNIETYEDYDHKFLVQWVEGYGDAKPQVVRMSEMQNNDDWGLDEDFLSFLNHSKEGEEILYTDPSGIVVFQKAPRI